MSLSGKLGAGPVSRPTVLNDILNYVDSLNQSLYADSQTRLNELSTIEYEELINYCTNKFDLDAYDLDEIDPSVINLGDLAEYITKLNPATEILC